jgi:hypothetical protein
MRQISLDAIGPPGWFEDKLVYMRQAVILLRRCSTAPTPTRRRWVWSLAADACARLAVGVSERGLKLSTSNASRQLANYGMARRKNLAARLVSCVRGVLLTSVGTGWEARPLVARRAGSPGRDGERSSAIGGVGFGVARSLAPDED